MPLRPKASPLSQFLDRHAGKTAWLFGKGPGLDHFNFSDAGKLRCAINDVIGSIPHCLYGFAADSVRGWADVYCPEHTLFQPERALSAWDSSQPGRVSCQLVTYADDWTEGRTQGTREELAECLQVRRGTIGSALQILHIMGVSEVIAVGIDGGNRHSSLAQWRTKLKREHFKQYNAIRADAIRVAEELGINLQFYHPNQAMSHGKTTIKMLQSCFVEGEPFEAGKQYTLNPEAAQRVISIGRAVAIDSPARETASAKPVLETASLPPAVKKATVAKSAKNASKK